MLCELAKCFLVYLYFPCSIVGVFLEVVVPLVASIGCKSNRLFTTSNSLKKNWGAFGALPILRRFS